MSAEILRLDAAEAERRLGEFVSILDDCVQGGASVSFMLPFGIEPATAFWRKVIGRVADGEAILLAALDDAGTAVGTVQLQLSMPPNQPHRADVAKLLVHRRARGQGLGRALMARLEEEAREAGRTLLVLDTASAAAERVYATSGWTRAGVIPGYALLPTGEPCDTVLFWKRV